MLIIYRGKIGDHTMTLELVPKYELTEWGEEDERRKEKFEARMNSGSLYLVSAKNPKSFKK